MRWCVEAEGAEEEMAPRCENTEVPPSSYIILMRHRHLAHQYIYNIAPSAHPTPGIHGMEKKSGGACRERKECGDDG